MARNLTAWAPWLLVFLLACDAQQDERTFGDGSIVEVSNDALLGYPVSASFSSGEEGDGFRVLEFSQR